MRFPGVAVILEVEALVRQYQVFSPVKLGFHRVATTRMIRFNR